MRLRRREPPPPPPPARLDALVSELERVTAELRALTKTTAVERQERRSDR